MAETLTNKVASNLQLIAEKGIQSMWRQLI